jgi:hypothetical protein
LVFVLLVAFILALFVATLLIEVAATLVEFGVDFADGLLGAWLPR